MTEQLPAVIPPGAIISHLGSTHGVPSLIAAAGAKAQLRFLEFFASTIRNPHTRRAYGRAVADFLTWCEDHGVPSIAAVQPLHVATWIEMQTQVRAAPSVKQQLAAVRRLFDWLVTGQVVPVKPGRIGARPLTCCAPGQDAGAGTGRGACALGQHRRIEARGVTRPGVDRPHGLYLRAHRRCARMKVEDVFVENRRLWVRLLEKGGKAHAMPCHHNLETYLTAYLEQTGLMDDDKGPLFRTIGRGTGQLTRTPLPQANAYAMIRRRAASAGIATKVGNHSFRATGITAYLKNGGTLEKAAQMANHASTRTTQLYDRRHDEMSFDEVEKIRV